MGAYDRYVMAVISHPRTGDSIEVEIVDEATHHGHYVQVQAVEDGVELRDRSGSSPWVDSDRVEGVDA